MSSNDSSDSFDWRFRECIFALPNSHTARYTNLNLVVYKTERISLQKCWNYFLRWEDLLMKNYKFMFCCICRRYKKILKNYHGDQSGWKPHIIKQFTRIEIKKSVKSGVVIAFTYITLYTDLKNQIIFDKSPENREKRLRVVENQENLCSSLNSAICEILVHGITAWIFAFAQLKSGTCSIVIST